MSAGELTDSQLFALRQIDAIGYSIGLPPVDVIALYRGGYIRKVYDDARKLSAYDTTPAGHAVLAESTR